MKEDRGVPPLYFDEAHAGCVCTTCSAAERLHGLGVQPPPPWSLGRIDLGNLQGPAVTEDVVRVAAMVNDLVLAPSAKKSKGDKRRRQLREVTAAVYSFDRLRGQEQRHRAEARGGACGGGVGGRGAPVHARALHAPGS